MSVSVICAKERKQNNGEKAGKNFNQNGLLGNIELKHFSPSLGY
jgi:hypothetical protein